MAAVGGFPGQDHGHELRVYQQSAAFGSRIAEKLSSTLMVAVGKVKSAVGQCGKGGWSWGDTSGGEWLTIPGSANTRPTLGASPGTAYRFGPDVINGTCAFVAPMPHSGVSTGVAYRILQVAEARELGLTAALAYEDQEEDAGVLDPDDRVTCHGCNAWATFDHVASEQHRLMLSAGEVRAYEADMARLAGLVGQG